MSVGSKIDILLNSLLLVYRESTASEKIDKSNDLVKNIINTIKDTKTKIILGGETSKVDELITLITNIMNNPSSYDLEVILQSLNIILKDSPDIYKNIESQLKTKLPEDDLTKSLLVLRNRLSDYYITQQLADAVSKANYQLITGKLDNLTIGEFKDKLVNTLEALTTSVSEANDPAVIDEIDLANVEAVGKIITKTLAIKMGNSKLKFGWKLWNQITQGGGRRGECVLAPALQHQYKSGTCRSIFMQIPRFNIPVMIDKHKKPLVVYISAEDDTPIIMSFMYQYLYLNKYKKSPVMEEITPAEIAEFIKTELGVNGYHVKIMKINPSEWSIKHLFNKVLQWEAEGFELHAMLFDYLAKLPTTGCTITGPGGTDVRDMLNRYRNFFNIRETFSYTPWQISTEAKQLIRNGTPDSTFVKEMVGKGYTELSKQVDQVVDLEIYQHKAKINGKWCLTFQRGKHRIDTVIDDDKMYGYLQFPYQAPIMEDVNDTDSDVMQMNDEFADLGI